jgi:hypothetical protein
LTFRPCSHHVPPNDLPRDTGIRGGSKLKLRESRSVARFGFAGSRATTPVFVALARVTPQGPEGALDPETVAGAMVRAYVQSATAEGAESLVRSAIAADGMTVVEVEWCVDDNETDWENPNDGDAMAHVAAARLTVDVIYGEFYAWGHEE